MLTSPFSPPAPAWAHAAAPARTVVDTGPKVLLASWGSNSFALTLAELLSVPEVEVGVTVMVNVAVPGLAREATVQVTVPELTVQSGAEPKGPPAGRVSVTVTPVAVSGPPLVTVSA